MWNLGIFLSSSLSNRCALRYFPNQTLALNIYTHIFKLFALLETVPKLCPIITALDGRGPEVEGTCVC